MPADVLIGIVLTCLGVGFTGIIFAWGFFGLRAIAAAGDIAAFFQTQYALSAAQSLILNVGLFLLLVGILRILPRGSRWSWLGPALILAGGVAITIANVLQIYLAPFLFPPQLNSQSPGLNVGLVEGVSSAAFFVGSMVATVGTLLSLVAVARGVLTRRASPEPSAPE